MSSWDPCVYEEKGVEMPGTWTRAQFGEDGRVLNTECPVCDERGQDPLGHVHNSGDPSCRAHSKRTQGPCLSRPVRGQSTCRFHGGSTRSATAKGEQRLALARIRETLATDQLAMGGQLDVSPTDAMLLMVKEAAFNVAFLRSMVERLQQGYESGLGVGDGLVGRVDADSFKASEHVIVAMYDRERDRLVRYAKLCRDAGIEEKKVQVMEEQGRWLTRTIDLVFERLGLTPEQQQSLPSIMREVVDVLEVDSWEEDDDEGGTHDEGPAYPAPVPPG